MQPTKQLIRVLDALADEERYLFSASDLQGALPGYSGLPVLLSRARKSGVLERVCRGIYLYPRVRYPRGLVLFHVAARLRADGLNYLSLETALSDAGAISQIPIQWVTLMSSGRSNVIDCGEFGHIEFVHTARRARDVAGELTYDRERRLWRASVAQALRDMRVTRRSMDLVDMEVARELV